MLITTVDRLDEAEFSEQYFARKQPVLVRGGARDWLAVQRWSQDYLLKNYGKQVLPVDITEGADGFDNLKRKVLLKLGKMSIEDYFNPESHKGRTVYVGGVFLDNISTATRDEIGKVLFFPDKEAKVNAWHLWMGFPQSGSGLHYDSADNIFVQVTGTKRWTIFSLDDRPNLYVPTHRLRHFSPVNLFAPDLVRYPRFKQAKPEVFDVGPGDILYLPKFWPHHVQSYDFTVSLNAFFYRKNIAAEILWHLRKGPSDLVYQIEHAILQKFKGFIP